MRFLIIKETANTVKNAKINYGDGFKVEILEYYTYNADNIIENIEKAVKLYDMNLAAFNAYDEYIISLNNEMYKLLYSDNKLKRSSYSTYFVFEQITPDLVLDELIINEAVK